MPYDRVQHMRISHRNDNEESHRSYAQTLYFSKKKIGHDKLIYSDIEPTENGSRILSISF